MKRTWAIALNTYREALRKRVLLILPFFAAAIAATVWLVPAINEEARVRLVEQMSLGLTTFFGTIVAVFLAGWSMPAEIEGREIYSVITKPIRRVQVLLGKLLGFLLVLALLVAVMMGMGAIAVRFTAWRAHLPVSLARPLAPVAMTYTGQGSGQWQGDQLLVRITTTQIGERWEIPIKGEPPAGAATIPFVLRVGWLAGKPKWTPPSEDELAERDVARLRIEGYDAEGRKLWAEQSEVKLQYIFMLVDEHRLQTQRHLEGSLELPQSPTGLARLELTVLSTDPSYPLPPVRWYAPSEKVEWRFAAVPREILPEADAEFGLTIGQFGTGSRGVDVRFQFTNPETGESKVVQAPLKDNIRVKFAFPGELVSQDGRLEVTYVGSPENVYIGLRPAEPSLTLRQRPVPLEWGYGKATLLVLGELMLIATMAAMVSTVVSGPVAVLVALATWFAGTSAGFVKEYAEAAAVAEQTAQHVVHSHETEVLTGWLGTVLNPLLEFEAVVLPDFAHYAAAPHIIAGMDVPWSVMQQALTQTLLFVGAGIVVGWAIFRRREFK